MIISMCSWMLSMVSTAVHKKTKREPQAQVTVRKEDSEGEAWGWPQGELLRARWAQSHHSCPAPMASSHRAEPSWRNATAAPPLVPLCRALVASPDKNVSPSQMVWAQSDFPRNLLLLPWQTDQACMSRGLPPPSHPYRSPMHSPSPVCPQGSIK